MYFQAAVVDEKGKVITLFDGNTAEGAYNRAKDIVNEGELWPPPKKIVVPKVTFICEMLADPKAESWVAPLVPVPGFGFFPYVHGMVR